MSNITAVVTSVAAVALISGGIAYANAANSEPAQSTAASSSLAGTRTVTKSLAREGVLLEEDFEQNYAIIASYVKCPRRTHMLSGGFADVTDGITYFSFPDPDGKEAWLGATIASAGQNPRDFTVSVTCMGRPGQFPGRAFRTGADAPSARVPDSLTAVLTERAPR